MSERTYEARARRTVGGMVLGALVLFTMVVVLATRSGRLDGHGREVPKAGPRAGLAPLPTPSDARRALVDNPTDNALLRVGLFGHPLVPVGPSQLPENRELARALVAYDQGSAADAPQPLVGFLETHPNSAWKPALLVGLGAVYRKTGHFSKALESFRAAWARSKNLVTTNAQRCGHPA